MGIPDLLCQWPGAGVLLPMSLSRELGAQILPGQSHQPGTVPTGLINPLLELWWAQTHCGGSGSLHWAHTATELPGGASHALPLWAGLEVTFPRGLVTRMSSGIVPTSPELTGFWRSLLLSQQPRWRSGELQSSPTPWAMCVKERAGSAALQKLKVFAALNQMQNVIKFPNWKKFGEPGFILSCQHWVFVPSVQRWAGHCCVPHCCQSEQPGLITRLIKDGCSDGVRALLCPGPGHCPRAPLLFCSQGVLAALQSPKTARNR